MKRSETDYAQRCADSPPVCNFSINALLPQPFGLTGRTTLE